MVRAGVPADLIENMGHRPENRDLDATPHADLVQIEDRLNRAARDQIPIPVLVHFSHLALFCFSFCTIRPSS